MGKMKTAKTVERSDAGYIRKLCHRKHKDMSIKQSAVDDLDMLSDELYDQFCRKAAELLALNTPQKSTLTVREMDTIAKATFSPALYEKVNAASTDAVLRFAAHAKPEPE